MYLVNGYTMKEVKSVEEARTEIKKEIEKQNLSYKKVFSFQNENIIIEIYEYCTLYKETYLIIPSLEMQRYIGETKL